MIFKRDRYLQQLIERLGNGEIKVITGIRRCGKSYLLFQLFVSYLLSIGVEEDHIIRLALDDDLNEKYRAPAELSSYLRARVEASPGTYYILLDEIQYAISRDELRASEQPVKLYSVLNGLLRLPNVDIYVTGSNSKMLSHDIMTEFRGRGDVIEVHPLSFKEYYEQVGGERAEAFENYATYGGLPQVWTRRSDDARFLYLQHLFQEVYYKDILERYEIEYPDVLDELTDTLCSAVGSLTNVSKLTDTLRSVKKRHISHERVASYLNVLSECYLFRQTKRYDVKGKRYFEYPSKYYCEDIGLRNVRLNLRQQEQTHIMENVLYSDLLYKGYAVDLGVVRLTELGEDGVRHQKSCEIDFIAYRGRRKYYIQSALNLDTPAKAAQEARSLLAVKDFFQKIIVSKTMVKPWTDELGVIHVGLYDFLLLDDLTGLA